MGLMESERAAALSLSELEDLLDASGRDLLCQLYQDSLDLRALRESRIEEVVDARDVSSAKNAR